MDRIGCPQDLNTILAFKKVQQSLRIARVEYSGNSTLGEFRGFQDEWAAVVSIELLEYSAQELIVKDKPALCPGRRTVHVGLTFVFDSSQLATWQTFWAGVEYGVLWFTMNLYLDDVERLMDVHATSPFSAAMSGPGIWDVKLKVEARIP